MLKSHERFHSANGKRLILIVDDEKINRELLGAVLESDYELLYAEDGQTALKLIREQRMMLSLIMLDLQMPVSSGWDVLRELRDEPELRLIPVIVLTGDQKAEVECLELGAADFIPKPYPEPGVIQARVRRTIELSEDRDIIQSTERDPLTGLYNREFFYRYGSQYDKGKADTVSSDPDPNAEGHKKENEHGVRLRIVALAFCLIAALAAAVVLISGRSLTAGYQHIQTAATILLLLTVLAFVAFVNRQILKPLSRMVRKMQAQEPIEPSGAEELRFASRVYNEILEENRAAREKLSHEASHDALTGVFNRGAYELLMKSVDAEHIALLVVDVDNFKQVNDTFGHTMGDRVLKRVAEILQNSFRSVDIICRVGGDEFAVIMTRVNSAMRHLVKDKIDRANELLSHPKDDLPPVSLSVGVAFADRENPESDIFTDADTAAYRIKRAGGNGCGFFE